MHRFTTASRGMLRTAIRGIALALAVTGVVTALSITPASAAGANYWTRLIFWDPGLYNGNLYVDNYYPGAVIMTPRSNDAGQAWHMVQTVKPGWNNIFQLHSGLSLDGTKCLSYYDDVNAGRTVDTDDCTSGYATYWQKQFLSDGEYKLANVANGECINEGDGVFFQLGSCSSGAIAWTETQ